MSKIQELTEQEYISDNLGMNATNIEVVRGKNGEKLIFFVCSLHSSHYELFGSRRARSLLYISIIIG